MDQIRIATPEEVDRIADSSDLSSVFQVVTMGGKDFAVFRNCIEVDPMKFHEESSTQRRLIFAMNIETVLRLNGVKELYFNVPVADEKYRKVLETWGAETTSREPELRYKKVL